MSPRLPRLALALVLGLPTLALTQPAESDAGQRVVKHGAKPAKPAPSDYFTGRVQLREIVSPSPPGRTALGEVRFAAGARSHWHTHPAGQILYVTQGCGWTQAEGGPVTRICQGDTVYCPAGVKHWHGATATTAMTHLAATETVDGTNVTWLEPVSADQYRGPATAR